MLMKKVLPYLFAVILLASAGGHLLTPEIYAPLIPDFVPELAANVLAAISEAAVAILLLVPKWRHWGGLSFALLMLAFLPIHVWDLVRDDPFFTPLAAAVIRVVVQFLLIYAGWRIYKRAQAQVVA